MTENNKLKRYSPKSFKYAFKGVFHTLFNEPNFRLQLMIGFVSALMGFYFKIDKVEWGLIIISMGLLLSAEMINTVVENFIDTIVNEYKESAKIIKDISAGFVLISAITTLVILIIIFGEHILGLLI